MLHLDENWAVSTFCNLPSGTHNGQPWRGGVLFNDTASDCVRFVPRQGQPQAYPVVTYDEDAIEYAGIDDSKVARQGFGRGLCVVNARQGFGRGLCVVNDRLIAAGSSPSTISIYDVEGRQVVGSVNLSMDIRNAIHGLEIWPFPE
jgi:hypothetical protein